MRKLLRSWGPQQSFRSVHIAGTNGKGSVSAMCASIFREPVTARSVHITQSVEFEDGIQVDGVRSLQRDDGLAEENEGPWSVPRRPRGARPYLFDVTTAMAFLHFAPRRWR